SSCSATSRSRTAAATWRGSGAITPSWRSSSRKESLASSIRKSGPPLCLPTWCRWRSTVVNGSCHRRERLHRHRPREIGDYLDHQLDLGANIEVDGLRQLPRRCAGVWQRYNTLPKLSSECPDLPITPFLALEPNAARAKAYFDRSSSISRRRRSRETHPSWAAHGGVRKRLS